MITSKINRAVLFCLLLAGAATAQGLKAPTVHGGDVNMPIKRISPTAAEGADSPQWVTRLNLEPNNPKIAAVASASQARKVAEKELRKIRYQFLAQNKHAPKREEGLARLQDFNRPELYPLLIDLFKDDQMDVKQFLIDRFAESKSNAGDSSLAWVGIYDENPQVRAAAVTKLRSRIAKERSAVESTRLVLYEGFRTRKDDTMVASAKLASSLNLVEVMPWLIASQAAQQPTATAAATGTGSGNGALAWIMVGEQTAFVSDLTPVVGPNAVAFDPQLSVINTGTILRVLDAVVVEYHVELHRELVDWSTREYGQDTSGFGYNYEAWKTWYDKDFLPHLAAKRAEQERLAKEAASTKPDAADQSQPPAVIPGN